GKKNGKPLRYKNSNTNATLVAKKTGVKTCLQGRNESFHGEKKKSPLRFTKKSSSTGISIKNGSKETLKPKSDNRFNASTEKFGKKNGKPLRYKNSNTNATLVAKKTGVKTCLQGRNESFHGEKKKSPLRFTKKSSSTGISIKNGSKETLKPKSDNRFNASTEKFVTIKDNKLPPCALPPTPHRRKTYVVSTAKENNKENNYVLLEQTNYVSETTDTTHSSEMRTPHPKNNPSFHSEKMLPYSKFKTFDSHPRNTTSLIERSKLSRKAKKSSPPERNFKDMLDSICLTPTTSFNFGFTSPEDNRLPPFTVSATPDLPPCIVSPTSERRKTFAVSSPSKTGSESIQCTERHFTKKVRVVRSSTRSSKISANTDTFNDSLEDDDFVIEIVTKSSNKTWFEWQNHNEMSSVSSASSNDRQLNATVTYTSRETSSDNLTGKKRQTDSQQLSEFTAKRRALNKVDVAELWTQSCRKQEIELAPTRETVSSQYHVQHRLDALRKAACSLFRSEEIAKVLSKVAVHIDKKLISIRSLKCKVMSLLLSYNPLWLRIGLESIYGQTIALESNSDVRGLTKFIMTRLLSDPFIVTQYTHPTVTHLYVPGFEEAMKKFTLKKFLLLVYFLDKAKEKRLISHDPCLFCKDAEIKNSREILLSFSRDLLSGVGDITKHLKSLGYLVSQKQTYLDEFEYAVSCLGVELRDGIRLTSLSQELRVPAVSRLQKIHNVTVALTALKNAGYVLTGDITAKDISDGHREKTLSLLWQIIYKFQVIRYVARKKLKILKEEAKINLIVRQKAATIIQKNWRMYIQCKHYKHALNSIKKIQYWYRNAKITKWERAQYCRKRQVLNRLRATMLMKHDRQLYLKQKSAAIIIQRQWRATLEMRKQMSIYRLEKFAIITIQQKFRAVNEMKYRRRVFIQMKSAALKIQQWFRATLKMRNQRKDYLVRRSAALIIQRKYRAMKIMQIQRNLFLRQKSAAIIIQRKHRAKLLMQEHRKNYCLLRSTVITIQNRYRGKKLMLMERRNFLQLKHAAVFIQRKYRATLLMRNQMSSHQQLRSAAIIIQNKFRANKRMQLERQHFINKRMAAGIIQTRFRAQMMMLSQRNLFQKQKNAAITIQRKFRAMMLMQEQKKNYCLLRSAVIAIQIKYRAKKLMLTERQNFLQLKHAAVLIQRKFKATLFMRNQMSSYQQLRSAAIVIQNKFKANKMMREIRQKYLLQKSAALTLQSAFRTKKCMEVQRKQFLTQKLAAIVIQRWFRALLMMKDQRKIYMLQKSAAIVIQRNFRLHMSKMSKHRQALRKKQEILRKEATAAAKIQAVWRGYRVRKTGTQAMIAVRERALSISRNAFPGLTLQTRSIAALRTLEKTCSGRLIWALMELDTITQLSPKLCIDIANIGVVMKIFEYIKNANRSEVDKEMCLVATKVLINLARFSKTIDKVWEVHGNVSTITNLMFTWCGKNEALFCNCCTLLWLFVLDAERAKVSLDNVFISNTRRAFYVGIICAKIIQNM
ncbi:hypothetical protein C0J52_18716, partial [Blattella germanica]